MPEIQDMQTWDTRLVRKHGLQIAALADYGTTEVPETMFDPTTGRFLALPTGFHDLGYITTDGFGISRDQDNNDTMAVQSTQPVRSDTESDVISFSVTFQQTSPLTLALQYDMLLADAPALGSAVKYKRDGSGQKPYYSLVFLAQDGKGDMAVCRSLICPRVRIDDVDDRNFQRSDEEQHSFTVKAYYDFDFKGDMQEEMDGPGYRALASA